MSKDWFKFSINKARGVLIYYGVLFVLGLFIGITGLLHDTFLHAFSIKEKAVWTSVGLSVLGAVIFYIKKIYKSCVALEFEEPNGSEERIREFGIVVYFVFRPFFSIVFALLMILSLSLMCKIVTVSDDALNIGFFYLTSFLSFFCGYSSGDVLDVLENKGRDIINKVFDKNPL